MKKKGTSTPFRLVEIGTEQFAMFNENFVQDESVQLKASIYYGVNQENNMIACFCNFQFHIKDMPIMKLDTVCKFAIPKENWNNFIDKNNNIEFEIGFLRHLAMISVGTARGILHCKTENTKFNKFFLPTVNVEEIVNKPSKFELD